MSHRDNKDRRTLYCGNLHENVTEEMLFELFLQVGIDTFRQHQNEHTIVRFSLFLHFQSGPLESVTMKRDNRRSFAFITFKHEESVPYAEAIMENVYLFNRPLKVAARSGNKDFNNNPNEPYTPEIYVNDTSLHRSTPWHSQPQQQQAPLPIPLFSTNHNDNNYPPPPQFSYDERAPPQRFERRKQHSYHPYNRNEQDYSHMKQRNGNYNQQRRGGGGGGGYNSYHR
jgi:RNA recognition motif-containing protein